MKNNLVSIPRKSFYKQAFLVAVSGLLFSAVNAQGRHAETRGHDIQRGGGSFQHNQQSFPQHQDRPSRPPMNNTPAGRPGFGNGNRPDRSYQRPGFGNNNNAGRGSDRRPGGYNNNRPGFNSPGNRPGYGGGYGYGYNGRRPIYSRSNPSWRYGGYLPLRNSMISSFPFAYQTINFGGFGYRYYNGIYYRPYNNIFRVVAPPIGIYIHTLPIGYSRIYVGNDPYYYYNGTYYDQSGDDNYTVVDPPVGAVVESIPEGYETVVIDGETYYTVDNVQYKPVVQDNGEIWYEVIKVN